MNKVETFRIDKMETERSQSFSTHSLTKLKIMFFNADKTGVQSHKIALMLCAVTFFLTLSYYARPAFSATLWTNGFTTPLPDYTVSAWEVFGDATLCENGYTGGGLYFSAFNQVRFSMDKQTWPEKNGTFEFWILPKWEPGMERGQTLLRGLWNDVLQLGFLPDGCLRLAMKGANPTGLWHELKAPLIDFTPGKWRHIAITWTSNRFALHVDDKEVAFSQWHTVHERPPEYLEINGFSFIIDELQISSSEPSKGKLAQNSQTGIYKLHEPKGVYTLGFPLPEKGSSIHLLTKPYAEEFNPKNKPIDSSWGKPISLRMAKGEREPATFILCADKSIESVQVQLTGLPPAISSTIRYVVRSPMRRLYTYKPDDWEIVPRFLIDWSPQKLGAGEFREMWLDFHADKTIESGIYSGKIIITATGTQTAMIPVTVEVLPFVLPAIHTKRMGMYYSGKQRLIVPDRLRAELNDMREHGVTDLVLDAGIVWEKTPSGLIADASSLKALLAEIVSAGFNETIVIKNGLDKLARFIDPKDPAFLKFAKQGANLIHQLVSDFPQVRIVVTHGDEVFNENRLQPYISLAKIAKETGYPPLYITFHTNDDKADVLRKQIDPWVDIRGHHGYSFEQWLARGHKMREYKEELKRSGDEAWLYHNVRGSYYPALWGRIVNGVYLWTSPFTLNAPWTYQGYHGNPYDDTDSTLHDFGFAFPAPYGKGGFASTRIYECLREGQDDCRYFHFLKILASEKAAKKPEAAASALNLLLSIEYLVSNDQSVKPLSIPSCGKNRMPDFETKLTLRIGKAGTQGEAPLLDAIYHRLGPDGLEQVLDKVKDLITTLL